MEVYLNPVKYCKTPTGHPKGHPCCKIADYDDTALGTGTLTVHPWRAGPVENYYYYYYIQGRNHGENVGATTQKLGRI